MKRHINAIERLGRRSAGQAAAAGQTRVAPPLQPPDTHHLAAAEGWLGLGNWREANEDLHKIQPPLRAHPDVLSVKYKICAQSDKWIEAMLICRTLSHLEPDRAFGWLNLSVALHKQDRTREAYDTLLPILPRFPDDPLFRYALARYACRLGDIKEASAWLRRAFDLGDPFQLMSAALHDTGLQPLWTELGVQCAG